MKILYAISYITILSLYNCLINLPIKINDQIYPLPFYMYSNFVRILVSGHIYSYNIKTGEQIDSNSNDVIYDKYVHFRTVNNDGLNFIQIGSKNNGKIKNIYFPPIDNIVEYYLIKNNDILENLKCISIISISSNNYQYPSSIILSNNEIYFIEFKDTENLLITTYNIDDIQYISCENEYIDLIYCVYSTSTDVYMLLIINKSLNETTKIEGMSKSKGLKIFLKYKYFCSLTENSDYECVYYTLNNNDNSFNYTIIKQILSNCLPDYKDFTLADFNYNNDLIACCPSSSSINCQRINNNEKSSQFSIIADSPSFVRNLGIYNKFLITYQCGNDACLHFIFVPSCLKMSDFQVNILEKKVLDLESYLTRDTNTNYYIQFTELNSNGDIIYNNDIITSDSPPLKIYNGNVFEFEHKNNIINDEIIIKYKIIIEESYTSNECSFSILINITENYYNLLEDPNTYLFCESPCDSFIQYPQGYFLNSENKLEKCYETCSKCNYDFKNDSDYGCVSCNDNSKPINDNQKVCIHDDDYQNMGYYLENNILNKCYENCKTCSGGFDNFNEIHNCLTCKDDYLFLENTNNCYSKDLNGNGYILINDILYKCYDNCLSCSEKSESINDQKCIECKTDFYMLENTNNCFDLSYNNNGYYLHNNILSKCYRNCLTCENTNNEINENNQYCIQCINDYYFRENTKNCYKYDEIIPGYIFLNNLWQKCNENCKFCSINESSSNETNNGCIECKDENYLMIEGTTNCMKKDELKEGYFINENKIYKCNEKCKTCVNNKNNCIQCNNDKGYYYDINLTKSLCFKKEDLNDTAYFINNENNEYFWDFCYENCLSCNEKGNENDNKCLSCKNNFILINGNCLFNELELYDNCEDSSIFEDINISNNENKECSKIIKYTNLNLYKLINVADNSILRYTSKDAIINGNNFSIQIFRLNEIEEVNEISKMYKLSTIDINDCANYLKKYYEIPENQDLIIIKIDKNITNCSVNSVEYYIYDFDGNLLDSSLCSDYPISVSKSIINEELINFELAKNFIEEGIDIYDASNPFFNEICYLFSSINNTDITLSDRRKYIYQNVSFCEIGCEYKGIDYDTSTVNCKCDSVALSKIYNNVIKDNLDVVNNFIKDFKNIEMNKVKNNFVKGLSDTNLNVITCYKLFFSWKYDKNNIGFWIFNFFILTSFILFILFLENGLNPINNFLFVRLPKDLKNNINLTNNNEFGRCESNNFLNSSNPPKKLFFLLNGQIKFVESNSFDIYEFKENLSNDININDSNQNKFQIKTSNKYIKSNDINSGKKNKTFIYKFSKNNFINYKMNINNDNNQYFNKNKYDTQKSEYSNNYENENLKNLKKVSKLNKNLNSNSKLFKNNVKNKLNEGKEKKQNKYNDFNDIIINENNYNINEGEDDEKNIILLIMITYDKEYYFNFEYEDALKYDKRTFLIMYWDCIKLNQIIINTFFYEIFLEIRIIKIIFMILTFGIEFFLNAIFYTDKYVSEIYLNNGVLDFVYSLPKSIYSFLMCIFVNIFLEKLSNSKNELVKIIKSQTNKEKYQIICNNLINSFKKKLIGFFILFFSLFILFLYYVTCFCSVYHYNQIFWLYGSLQSIGMGMILPFFTSFIKTLIRFFSLKYKKKLVYKISNILNLFL